MNYKNLLINASEIKDVVKMDEVTADDSINPRFSINSDAVMEYHESILGYLSSGMDFSEVWNQTPEVIETDTEGEYLLISGYHTVMALTVALAVIEKNPDEYQGVKTNFSVKFKLYDSGKYGYRETAKYLAGFSNNHGLQLSHGEKSVCARNVLSTMNLTKDEGDDTLRPHVSDRKLAAQIGVSKTVVSIQRQKLIQERFGPAEDEEQDAEVDLSHIPDAEDVVETISELEGELEGQDDDDEEVLEIPVNINDDEDEDEEGSENDDDFLGFPNTDVVPEKKQSKAEARNKSFVQLGVQLDECLKVNPDNLSRVYQEVIKCLDTQQQRFANVYKDDAGIYDIVFSLLATSIDVLADENDNRP